MHELSIALSILDLAEEEGRRRNARVVAVHLKLGRLSGVVKEALLSAYELAREGTPMEQAELSISEVPLVVRCPQCARNWTLSGMDPLSCPDCGTPTSEIVTGRELEVCALELVS
jgi:hydrogenase nickel incorporation protein HypA/HybF